MLLKNIKSPHDLKKLSRKETEQVCGEIRDTIIGHCAEHGGHLASNLGMVEPTVALHRVFDSPRDSIIYDVGHQCYAHKLICGRYDSFSSMRSYGGISGFTNRSESEHDKLTAGHSGSALPTALGIAKATKNDPDAPWTVAVIGDGSFGCGMVYEALNSCHDNNMRLIIILNDNEMSISRNVGAMSGYFTRLRNSRKYFAFKKKFQKIVGKMPAGNALTKFFRRLKDFFKRLVMPSNLFENLGLYYMGPVNGNDEEKLEAVLREAKTKDKCTIIHMITLKGKGLKTAESNPENFHYTNGFDRKSGAVDAPSTTSFSSVFGEKLTGMRENNPKICAITAAMESGTGLTSFKEKYPDSFYDVGIAEECAVTFAGGLAIGGALPYCALYSTFMQRTYDQLLEDVALQGVHVVMGVDRAGLVPGDGVTHQGLFDVSMVASIPSATVYSPESYAELRRHMELSEAGDGLIFIRYPRGSQTEYDRSVYTDAGDEMFVADVASPDAVIITYGKVSHVAVKAAELCKKNVKVIRLAKVCPLDVSKLTALIGDAKLVYILEEGVKRGGIGEMIATHMAESGMDKKIYCHCAPDGFVCHGDNDSLLRHCNFTPEFVSEKIDSLLVS